MDTDDRIERSRELYERAVFGGDAEALGEADHELYRVEADLVLAQGRIMHARFLDSGGEDPHELELFEHAVALYQAESNLRGEAEALFWVGCFFQVVRGDDAMAVPALERSRELSERAGDPLTTSYALRHLGIAEHRAGRLYTARALLEESNHLRRELGFMPGVAANLVGLAYIAAAQGHQADALGLIEEAGAIAEASGAHGLTPQIREARTQISG